VTPEIVSKAGVEHHTPQWSVPIPSGTRPHSKKEPSQCGRAVVSHEANQAVMRTAAVKKISRAIGCKLPALSLGELGFARRHQRLKLDVRDAGHFIKVTDLQ
jgi:hypothetical protein